MLSLQRSLLISTVLALFACQGALTTDPSGNSGDSGADGLKPGDIVPASDYLPPAEALDYTMEERLAAIQAEADSSGGGFLDRIAWNTAVEFAVEQFEEPLGEHLALPLAALRAALDTDAQVQPDGTLLSSTSIVLDGVPVDIDVAITLNGDGTFTAQILANGVLRAEITTDINLNQANITIFDAAGTPVINVDFAREGTNFSVVFTNLVNQNTFTLSLENNVLFVQRDKGGDGQINQGGEFTLTVDLNNFSGQVTAFVLGVEVNLCFGAGSLSTVSCD